MWSKIIGSGDIEVEGRVFYSLPTCENQIIFSSDGVMLFSEKESELQQGRTNLFFPMNSKFSIFSKDNKEKENRKVSLYFNLNQIYVNYMKEEEKNQVLTFMYFQKSADESIILTEFGIEDMESEYFGNEWSKEALIDFIYSPSSYFNGKFIFSNGINYVRTNSSFVTFDKPFINFEKVFDDTSKIQAYVDKDCSDSEAESSLLKKSLQIATTDDEEEMFGDSEDEFNDVEMLYDSEEENYINEKIEDASKNCQSIQLIDNKSPFKLPFMINIENGEMEFYQFEDIIHHINSETNEDFFEITYSRRKIHSDFDPKKFISTFYLR